MQQHYELLYIVKSKVADADLDKVHRKVAEVVERSGGAITRQETWGKRRLAYPINRDRFGYYQLLEFDLESQKFPEVDRDLRLTPNLLRHLATVSAFATEAEREAEMRRLEEIEARQRAHEETVKRERETKAEKAVPPSEAETKRTKEKEEKKITLEQLDEKLEEILKEKDV